GTSPGRLLECGTAARQLLPQSKQGVCQRIDLVDDPLDGPLGDLLNGAERLANTLDRSNEWLVGALPVFVAALDELEQGAEPGLNAVPGRFRRALHRFEGRREFISQLRLQI